MGGAGRKKEGWTRMLQGPAGKREEREEGTGCRKGEGRKRGKGPVKVQRGEQEVVRFDVGGRWKDIPWKGGSGRDPGL